jgi:predicted N-acetyltransferase YhbS
VSQVLEKGFRPASIDIARPADARFIAALRTAVAQDMTRRFGDGHWSAIPSKAEVLKQMRASQMFVARHEDHIVGTVRLVTVNPRAMDSVGFTAVDSALYLLGLAVAPDWRKMGIGRQLVDAAKDAARARRAQALWLDAYDSHAGAGPFYLRCGFRRVSSSSKAGVPPGARVHSPLLYFEWLVD